MLEMCILRIDFIAVDSWAGVLFLLVGPKITTWVGPSVWNVYLHMCWDVRETFWAEDIYRASCVDNTCGRVRLKEGFVSKKLISFYSIFLEGWSRFSLMSTWSIGTRSLYFALQNQYKKYLVYLEARKLIKRYRCMNFYCLEMSSSSKQA